MIDVKFIYFEIKYIKGDCGTVPAIENENVLMIKPDTNSSGVMSCMNITERHGFDVPSFLIVDQHWVDLEKFSGEKHKVYDVMKKQVEVVLEKLNQKKC